jgi:predicted transcriptional regulator
MASDGDDREALIGALDREMLIVSAQSVLLSQAVADRLGLHPTDVECLEILGRGGQMTAGQLAARAGLTTGAATRLIDRLERSGYARRIPDPGDRRRVLVAPDAERIGRDFGPLYAPLAGAMAALYARYRDEELALILDFTTGANRATREQIARVRGAATDGKDRA